LVDLGVDHKVLEKKGAWIAFNGELVGQGREAAKQALRDNADLAAKVKAAIIEKVGGKNGGPAAEEGAE
jgi:recombination protein RecA